MNHVKGDGAVAIDEASRKLCPDLHLWVAFSSVACGKGNAGRWLTLALFILLFWCVFYIIVFIKVLLLKVDYVCFRIIVILVIGNALYFD